MSFLQIFVIFSFFLAHHHFRVVDKLVYLDIDLLPRIADRNKSETDIVKLCMHRMNLFCKILIRRIFYKHEILISRQPICFPTVKILLQNFSDTNYDFVSVISPELFIKIFQSVDIDGKRADRF